MIEQIPNIRFNELGCALSDISSKALSTILKFLEVDRLVKRKLYGEAPSRDKSLFAVLVLLIEWAIGNFQDIVDSRKKSGRQKGSE